MLKQDELEEPYYGSGLLEIPDQKTTTPSSSMVVNEKSKKAELGETYMNIDTLVMKQSLWELTQFSCQCFLLNSLPWTLSASPLFRSIFTPSPICDQFLAVNFARFFLQIMDHYNGRPQIREYIMGVSLSLYLLAYFVIPILGRH